MMMARILLTLAGLNLLFLFVELVMNVTRVYFG
jgi:hypothetical protein